MDNQPSYYKCSLFELPKQEKQFSFIQPEIRWKAETNQGHHFDLLNVAYSCSYEEKVPLSNMRPVGILPIRNSKDLLKYTLENLAKYEVFKHVDFIIVDDRSTDNLKELVDLYPVNYLRVDNEKGFNFSTLNNVAAKIAHDSGCEQIILWNADLWTDNKETIPNLIKLHNENQSTISGTRLLYPPFSWNNKEVSDNISSIFPNKKDSYRGTIQFGGGAYVFQAQYMTYFPMHFCRFKEKDYYLAKCDKLDNFVTGAFHIVDLRWFISVGGLNPSLSKSFQDVDICLRAVEAEKKVFYFGKDNYLLHDESVIMSKEKNDLQYFSDHILYVKQWNIDRFYKQIFKYN